LWVCKAPAVRCFACAVALHTPNNGPSVTGWSAERPGGCAQSAASLPRPEWVGSPSIGFFKNSRASNAPRQPPCRTAVATTGLEIDVQLSRSSSQVWGASFETESQATGLGNAGHGRIMITRAHAWPPVDLEKVYESGVGHCVGVRDSSAHQCELACLIELSMAVRTLRLVEAASSLGASSREFCVIVLEDFSEPRGTGRESHLTQDERQQH